MQLLSKKPLALVGRKVISVVNLTFHIEIYLLMGKGDVYSVLQVN